MKLTSLLRYKGIFLLPIILLLLDVCPLFAQNELSIGVAPTSKTLKLKQSETYSDEIVFWNLSQSADTYKVFISGFRQIENQPGTAIVLTKEEDEQALYSASKWITVEKETLYLEPNKNTKLRYTINVPNNITEGEYTAEIFLISENDTNNKETVAFANLASGMPILIQIGDEFIENAELLSFMSDRRTYEKNDIKFLTKIKNLGNTHISPTGDIIIENIFKQEVARIPFNKNNQSLLRDNTGNYEDSWQQSSYLSPNKALAIGPMTAKLLFTYKSSQPGFSALSAETTFWVIPWKIILAILGVLLVIIIFRIIKKTLEDKNEIS
jgi:hypothetical protein